MPEFSPTTAETESFLQALRQVCDLIHRYTFVDTIDGAFSVETLLRQHFGADSRDRFFGLKTHDLQVITQGLRLLINNAAVARKYRDEKLVPMLVLGVSSEVVADVVHVADAHLYGKYNDGKRLEKKLEVLKTLCSEMIAQRVVRSLTLYRDKPGVRQAIDSAKLSGTLEDMLDEDVYTEASAVKLSAFLIHYSSVEGDARNLFGSLRGCMVPSDLFDQPDKKVYKCVRPLHRDMFNRILPIRIFDGNETYKTDLNGLCARQDGWRFKGGDRLGHYAPASSDEYARLTEKVRKGTVDVVNVTATRLGRVAKDVTMSHLRDQHWLDSKHKSLYARLERVVLSAASLNAKLRQILDILGQKIPAVTTDRLTFTLNSIEMRDFVRDGNVTKFMDLVQKWKLQYLLDGGFRVKVSDDKTIIVNCNEMMRGGLKGKWVDRASELKCSLVSASNDELTVTELARKDEVFNIIRNNSVGWTEGSLRVLNRWMGMAERWNRKKFEGSGGFAIERFADNSLIRIAPRDHEEAANQVKRKPVSDSDTEDRDELLSRALQ